MKPRPLKRGDRVKVVGEWSTFGKVGRVHEVFASVGTIQVEHAKTIHGGRFWQTYTRRDLRALPRRKR